MCVSGTNDLHQASDLTVDHNYTKRKHRLKQLREPLHPMCAIIPLLYVCQLLGSSPYLVSVLMMPGYFVLLRHIVHQHFAFAFLEHLSKFLFNQSGRAHIKTQRRVRSVKLFFPFLERSQVSTTAVVTTTDLGAFP